MGKKYSIFITVLFCLFIFGFGAALLVNMALPRTFSEQENRYLAQMPELKAGTPDVESFLHGGKLWQGGNFFNGEFMGKFEDFVIDQFPLRDQWIQLKARSERLLGKRENNSVYFGNDGQTLFAFFTPPSGEELAKRMGYVNALADNVEVPVYFSLVPDKSYVWADRLPANAPNVDDGSMNAAAQALLSPWAHYVDLYDALAHQPLRLSDEDYPGQPRSEHPAIANLFYRTDHHWTTRGAYQGYKALAQAMNGSVTALDYGPEKVSGTFYGTTWSSAGAGWVEPDEMYIWVPEGTLQVTGYPEGEPVDIPMYDLSKLEVKDKYSMFLGGNQPLCVLRNPAVEGGKKLLVVRDSYSDSLAPFLGLDYSEVHLWDLRYNNLSLKQYVEENGIDQVLVLYSASNFSSDMNLFKLGL